MKKWAFFGLCASALCGIAGGLVVACDSSDAAHPENFGQREGGLIGANIDSGATDTGAPETLDASDDGGVPTWTDVYTTIIKPGCLSCHGGAGPVYSGNLDMSTQPNAYADLVGVMAAGPACGTSGETRVVPGSASTSLIYQKLTMTTPPCGVQMPKGRTPLPQSYTDMLAAWINAGAIDDTKAATDAGDDGGSDDGGTD